MQMLAELSAKERALLRHGQRIEEISLWNAPVTVPAQPSVRSAPDVEKSLECYAQVTMDHICESSTAHNKVWLSGKGLGEAGVENDALRGVRYLEVILERIF